MKGSTKTILIVILFIAAYFGWKSYNYGGTSYDATYICKSDKNIRIEFINHEDLGEIGTNLVCLHLGDDLYEGFYIVIKKGIFKRKILLNFYDYNNTEDNPEGYMSECFIISRNKMKVDTDKSVFYYSQNSIFESGQKFYRKTWWTTWGRTAFIILSIIGFIIAFSDDIIRFVTGNKNYESKNELIKDLKDEIRDPMVNGFKEFVEDFKEEMSEIGIELSEVGPNKVEVIKAIREMTGFSLTEAKNLVDSAPIMWPKSVSQKEADHIKAKLEAEGAKVTLKILRETKIEPDFRDKMNMVTCTNCGKFIDESVKFCQFCGAKVEIKNQSETKMDMIACPNCGNTVAENDNFCPYCGEQVIRQIN